MPATHLTSGSQSIPIARAPVLDGISRGVDIVMAALLLTALAPLFGVIWLAIRLDSPGPALFRQSRCGRGGRPFMITKFRTMHHGAAADAHRAYVLGVITGETGKSEPSAGNGGLHKLENDSRVTRAGAFLRRFSFDELLQLWNVLLGEMTLVGPRPPIQYEVDNYPPHWLARLSVKPGLTGLWQVSGRSRLDYADMVALDLDYVQRRSLLLNIRILAKTVRVVVSGQGAV